VGAPSFECEDDGGRKLLPDFSGVASGNWLFGIKQFGGRMYNRPRVDWGL